MKSKAAVWLQIQWGCRLLEEVATWMMTRASSIPLSMAGANCIVVTMTAAAAEAERSVWWSLWARWRSTNDGKLVPDGVAFHLSFQKCLFSNGHSFYLFSIGISCVRSNFRISLERAHSCMMRCCCGCCSSSSSMCVAYESRPCRFGAIKAHYKLVFARLFEIEPLTDFTSRGAVPAVSAWRIRQLVATQL